MWFGFILSSYAVIANDSIQTIGIFITSNARKIKWFYLWFFTGIILIVTLVYSWYKYNGDISYQRLSVKGLSVNPKSFSFLQIISPVILILLTRMYIPVSTTFLLLNTFTTDISTIVHIINKSLAGYLVTFLLSIIIWYL